MVIQVRHLTTPRYEAPKIVDFRGFFSVRGGVSEQSELMLPLSLRLLTLALTLKLPYFDHHVRLPKANRLPKGESLQFKGMGFP